MEVVGYCTIKKDGKTGVGPKIETFLGQDCRVMEFTPEGDVLVVNRDGTAMAMFDACDVVSKFECSLSGDVICPPNLNLVEQMVYHTKVITRQGGYNNLLRNMVIAASLHKGKFNDTFLFQQHLCNTDEKR